MRCELMGPRLSAWVDGELSGVSGWLVRRHVASCAVCAAEVESLRALNRKLSAINPVLTPLAPTRFVRPPLVLGLGAATALAGITVFVLLPRPSGAPQSDFKRVALASPLPELVRNGGVFLSPASNANPVSVFHSNPSPIFSEPAETVPPRSVIEKRRTRRLVHRVRREERQPEVVRVATARKRVGRVRPLSASRRVAEPVKVALADRSVAGPLESRPERDSFIPPRPAIAPPPAAVAMAPSLRARRESKPEDEAPRRVRAVLVITPTRYENVVLVQPGAMEIDEDDKEREGEPPSP